MYCIRKMRGVVCTFGLASDLMNVVIGLRSLFYDVQDRYKKQEHNQGGPWIMMEKISALAAMRRSCKVDEVLEDLLGSR